MDFRILVECVLCFSVKTSLDRGFRLVIGHSHRCCFLHTTSSPAA